MANNRLWLTLCLGIVGSLLGMRWNDTVCFRSVPTIVLATIRRRPTHFCIGAYA